MTTEKIFFSHSLLILSSTEDESFACWVSTVLLIEKSEFGSLDDEI